MHGLDGRGVHCYGRLLSLRTRYLCIVVCIVYSLVAQHTTVVPPICTLKPTATHLLCIYCGIWRTVAAVWTAAWTAALGYYSLAWATYVGGGWGYPTLSSRPTCP